MKILCMLSMLAFLIGCQNAPLSVDSTVETNVVRENPYTVASMAKAAEALGYEPLSATHLYVKTQGEVDSDLISFDNPIEAYVPEGVVKATGWEYTWFPIGRKVNFTYELISEIVLQDDKLSKALDNYSEIEFESKKLTNNLPKDASLKKTLAGWYPEGQIKILDDTVGGTLKYVPDITVRISDWFKIADVNTNSYGYFKCGHTSFTGKVRYSLRLNSPGNKVLVLIDQGKNIVIQGPEQSEHWFHNMNGVNNLDWFYVAVYTGTAYAVRYSGSNYTPKIIMFAQDRKSVDTRYGDFIYSPIFKTGSCRVFRYRPTGQKVGFLQLATTAAHESGHYMHWGMDKDTYFKATFKLQEAWACLRAWDVSCYLLGDTWTNKVGNDRNAWYEMLLRTNGIHCQLNRPGDNTSYYPLFIDLKDKFNNQIISSSDPEDYVSGKSTLTMERILKDNKCKNFDNFMDAFVREDLDDYMFEYFRYWWGRGY